MLVQIAWKGYSDKFDTYEPYDEAELPRKVVRWIRDALKDESNRRDWTEAVAIAVAIGVWLGSTIQFDPPANLTNQGKITLDRMRHGSRQFQETANRGDLPKLRNRRKIAAAVQKMKKQIELNIATKSTVGCNAASVSDVSEVDEDDDLSSEVSSSDPSSDEEDEVAPKEKVVVASAPSDSDDEDDSENYSASSSTPLKRKAAAPKKAASARAKKSKSSPAAKVPSSALIDFEARLVAMEKSFQAKMEAKDDRFAQLEAKFTASKDAAAANTTDESDRRAAVAPSIASAAPQAAASTTDASA